MEEEYFITICYSKVEVKTLKDDVVMKRIEATPEQAEATAEAIKDFITSTYKGTTATIFNYTK